MFAFVPRKVAKKAPVNSSASTDAKGKAKAPSAAPVALSIPQDLPSFTSSQSGTSKVSSNPNSLSEEEEEDLVNLVLLALSEYAIWSNGELRRCIECSIDGFIPLDTLIRHSPILHEVHHGAKKAHKLILTGSTIIKSLRKYAADSIQVRMVLSGPSWTNWSAAASSSGPSSSTSKGEGDAGMYEVRRKQVDTGDKMEYTRDDWEKRTVYFENIPPEYRSVAGVYRFTQLVYPSVPEADPTTPTQPEPTHPTFRIQRITFPPHRLDASNTSDSLSARKKCKGFAFVVLSSAEDAERMCETWNWDRNHSSQSSTSSTSAASTDAGTTQDSSESQKHTAQVACSAAITSAQKHSFRTLPKARWDALKEEYLAWKGKILREVFDGQEGGQVVVGAPMDDGAGSEYEDDEDYGNQNEKFMHEGNISAAYAKRNRTRNQQKHSEPSDRHMPPSTQTNRSYSRSDVTTQAASTSSTQSESNSLNPPLTSTSSYPPSCLLFVRNVHPGTNKTTLRKLFTSAFRTESSSVLNHGKEGDHAITYIDYIKNTDTAHMRVSSSSSARAVLGYFSSSSRGGVVQKDGLDDTGTVLASDVGNGDDGVDRKGKPIAVEMITGKREQLYWEKVPLRVRQEAVKKALDMAVNDASNKTSASAGAQASEVKAEVLEQAVEAGAGAQKRSGPDSDTEAPKVVATADTNMEDAGRLKKKRRKI